MHTKEGDGGGDGGEEEREVSAPQTLLHKPNPKTGKKPPRHTMRANKHNDRVMGNGEGGGGEEGRQAEPHPLCHCVTLLD